MLARLTHTAERGQVLIALALMAPVLLAMAGMAVDIGRYADDKRTIQNAADAIALAAAQQLCAPSASNSQNAVNCTDTDAARTTAVAYAAKNNVTFDPATDLAFPAYTPGVGNPSVRVTLRDDVDFAFVRVLGIDSKRVAAHATAIKTTPGAMSGVIPFAVTQCWLDTAAPGTPIVIHDDANGGDGPCGTGNGNYGSIQIDNTGKANNCKFGDTTGYICNIEHGTTYTVCSSGQTDCDAATCPGTASQCAETSPQCDGPVCPSLTGVGTGPMSAMDTRLNATLPNCDTFAEVFSPSASGDGSYDLNPDCNPWNGPGACPTPEDDTEPPSSCSRRVVVVPVIDSFGKGTSDFTMLGFSLLFLDQTPPICPQGNDCTVTGIFVKSDVSVNAITGVYDAESSIHFTRLTE
jgi:Flp pilus assembly protein TadG